MTEDLITNRAITQLYHKSLFEHLRCILFNKRALLSFFGWNIAIVSAFMAVLGMGTYFLDKRLFGFVPFAIFLAIALIVSFGKAIHSYITGCPKGLERESPSARRIAQLQPRKWEFKLARQLLHDRVKRLDSELIDIKEKRVFVPMEKQLDTEEYFQWQDTRRANALRIIAVAKQLLIYDFLEVLISTDEKPADPIQMVTVIERIKRLYSDTLDYERDSYKVEPPGKLAKLHGYAVGWTDPIRSGVHQLLEYLDRGIRLPSKAHQTMEYEITLEEPPNLSRFNMEMEHHGHGSS